MHAFCLLFSYLIKVVALLIFISCYFYYLKNRTIVHNKKEKKLTVLSQVFCVTWEGGYPFHLNFQTLSTYSTSLSVPFR